MGRFVVTILLSFFTYSLLAEPVLVGLFYGANHLRVTMRVSAGSYQVWAGGNQIFEIYDGESLDITNSNHQLNIFYQGKNYTDLGKVKFLTENNAHFKLQPAGQKPSARVYEETLIAFPYQGRLQLVNELEIENYVSGVIEAESGTGQELEYYKVQAVISRTYALNNLTRHQPDGFHVCDATHCQVYHGKPRFEMKAAQAALETKDIVIVDHNIELITAAFHSNCGGNTLNAEQVWSKPTSYLVGRADTFCLNMPHSTWTKTFPLSRWNNYLENKRHPLNDELAAADTLPFISLIPKYTEDNLSIPMKTIREDFKLRSANFRTEIKGDSITFIGRGFGHAVGLCQEGAMNMAMRKKRYEDIIHFYYKDVHLIPRYMIWFYRE